MGRLTNYLTLLAARKAAPTARAVTLYGMNGIQPPYGVPAAQYFAGELVALGLTANRSAITWSSVATAPGVYDWTQPDYTINALIAAGIKPCMQLIFSPSWAVPGGPWSARPFADMPNYATNPADFTTWVNYQVTFAQAAATRYGATIEYELWNEWATQSGYWQEGGSNTQPPHIAGFSQLYVAWQPAIKAIAPTAKCCIGGVNFTDGYTGNGTAGIAAIQTLIPLLNTAVVRPDAVGMHPYPLGGTGADPMIDLYPAVGKNSFHSIGRMQKAMVALGWGDVELWVTEDGYINNGVLLTDAFNGFSEANKSAWIKQRFEMINNLYSANAVGPHKAGVTRYHYYKLENYSNGSADTDSTGVYTGTPIGGPHTQLPSGAAVAAFVQEIVPGQFMPLLTRIATTSPSAAVMANPVAAATASGFALDGTSIACTPLFKSGVTSVATINASTGVITLVGPGTTPIYASTTNTLRSVVASTPIILTVAAQIPTTGTMTPNPFSIAVSTGGTATMAVSYTDQLGTPIVGQPAGTFGSSDPTNAPVDPVTGVVTAVGVSTGVVITFTPTTGNTCTATGNVTANPVLQITNAPSQLINVGALLLAVTDGTNPVTGCTFVISDGTKATMSGQYLVGVGSSGTFTIKAQKAAYDDSSLSTVTCTGGGILDDKDTIGLSNGAPVTTYTDLDGNVWSQATPPTYATNDYNGHASLVFNGTSQSLQSGAAVTRLNSAGATYAAIFTPTSNAPSSNELMLDNRDVTNGQGFVLGRNQVTMAPYLAYYTTPSNLQLEFDGTALSQNTQYRRVDRVSSGHQTRWVNGVANGTQATDPTYRNPTTSPPIASKGAAIGGSPTPYFFAATKLSLEILVNRYVTDAEATQLDQKMQLYIATAGSTVTSVNLFYNSSAANPMLLFTGSTYTLVAKDQSGNVLSGVGTWSTTDGTNVPVGASTGVIAPNAEIMGATITYTHTASGHTASVDVSVVKQPTWLKSESVTYANDAALRNAILSSVTTGNATPAPTGTAGCLYQDGSNEGSVSLDATRPFMGRQTLLLTLPSGGSAAPQLAAPLPSAYARLWAITVKRYDSGFTTVGSGGGASSYKDGPFGFNASQSGRTGVVYSNTNGIYGESYLQSGSIVGGADETSIGTVGTEWTDQAWYADIWLYEGTSNLMSERVWRFKIGTNPNTANLVSNTAVVGPMNVGFSPMALNYVSPLGQNYNQTIISTLFKSVGFWGVADGVTYGDPLGLLQDATTPTLSGITGGTIAHGTNGATVTLTGTNLNVNCYPFFSDAGVLVQSISLSGGGTTMTIIVNVTSGAPLGAGTVQVVNACSQQASGTQVVLIT